MPAKKSTPSKSRTKVATTTTRATGSAKSRIQKQQNYTAKTGDTLKSVAEKFQVPLKFLAFANNLAEGAKLSAGTAVRIPELKFDPFGRFSEAWVEIGPGWMERHPTTGNDKIIQPKIKGTGLKL